MYTCDAQYLPVSAVDAVHVLLDESTPHLAGRRNHRLQRDADAVQRRQVRRGKEGALVWVFQHHHRRIHRADQSFAGVGGLARGLVLKIDVQNGKNVQLYSWFSKDEAVLVLTPNMVFMVCRAGKPYVVNGITYIDLLQLPSETLYS